MSKGEKPILSVRIDAEILKQLDELAEQANSGRAEIVERCLALGMAQESQMSAWLKGKVSGPFLEFLTHPRVLKAVLNLIGEDVDPTALKLREGAIGKRRSRGKTKLAEGGAV